MQQELYEQVAKNEDYEIPINMGFVVPTHAGHPQSQLATNGARYIFHTVSVVVDYAAEDRSITPIPNSRIQEAVSNCLNKAIEIDQNRGVISPADTKLRLAEEKLVNSYKPIDTLIFPLFATGRGGRERETDEVAERIILGIREYLTLNRDNNDFKMTAIHVCAYSQFDVSIVQSKMDALLKQAR
jgi:hypothetical protein